MTVRTGSLLHHDLGRVENRASTKTTLSHAVLTTSGKIVQNSRLNGLGGGAALCPVWISTIFEEYVPQAEEI